MRIIFQPRMITELEHFLDTVNAGATILLAASVFHFNIISIPERKAYLKTKGIPTAGWFFGHISETEDV